MTPTTLEDKIYYAQKIEKSFKTPLSWMLNDLKTTYQKTGFVKTISLLAIGGIITIILLLISFWLAFFVIATGWIIWIIEAIREVEKKSVFEEK